MTSARSTAWRDLGIRAVSAAILTPLAVLSLWLGGIAWLLLLWIFVVGMGLEWAKLSKIDWKYAFIFVFLLIVAGIETHPGRALILVPALAVMVAFISRRAILGLGFIYICPAYVSLLVMRGAPDGFRNVLFLLVVVWGTDIGAYLMGRLIGGPRLAPSISPGKTWSGAVGGLVAAALAGAAAGYEHPLRAAVLSLALSFIAQAGDLLESAIKRHFGVKDSGKLIPGHGGVLDRLDGVLTAAPAAFLWSALATPHAMLWMPPP